MRIVQLPIRIATLAAVNAVIWSVTAIALAGLFMPSAVSADELGPVTPEVAGRVEVRADVPAADVDDAEIPVVVDTAVSAISVTRTP